MVELKEEFWNRLFRNEIHNNFEMEDAYIVLAIVGALVVFLLLFVLFLLCVTLLREEEDRRPEREA